MKLAVLGAGIDACRQFVEKRGGPLAAGQLARQFPRIDASYIRPQAAGEHFGGQFAGRLVPQREERRDARRQQLLFPIFADVL